MTEPIEKLKQLEKSFKNLDDVWPSLSKKYGDDGALRILSTQAGIHMMATQDTQTILRLAEKIALFNRIKSKD